MVTVSRIAILGFIGVVWHLMSHSTSANILPSPSETWAAALRLWSIGMLAQALGQSLKVYATGFSIACLMGVMAGLLMGVLKPLGKALEVFVFALAATPRVAFIPLIIVTYSVDEALILGNQIIILSPRPGRVVEHLPVKFRDRAAHDDPRDQIGFAKTRKYLANRLKDLVLNDPGSDFYDPSRSHNTMSARHIVNMSDPDTKTGLRTTGDVVAFVKH